MEGQGEKWTSGGEEGFGNVRTWRARGSGDKAPRNPKWIFFEYENVSGEERKRGCQDIEG